MTILGMGGVAFLRALGHNSFHTYHMNEGHSAFLALERIRQRVEKQGLEFSSALQVVAANGGSLQVTIYGEEQPPKP